MENVTDRVVPISSGIRWCLALRSLVFGLSSVIWLSGCVTTEATPEEVAGQIVAEPTIEEVIEEKPVPLPEDYPVRPFEGDALYDLLVAEVAGYRANYELALEKYLAAAEQTQDAGVARRATRLALYMKNDGAALRTIEIWTREAPDDIDAHRHATDVLLRAGRFDQAIEHMERVKKLGGLAKFDIFAFRAANMDADQRQSLIGAMDEMLHRHPGDEQLKFSRAVLLEQEGRLEEALVMVNEIVDTSTNVNVSILKMSLLTSLDRYEEAKSFLVNRIERYPDSRRLRLVLARLLFELDDLKGAEKHYEQVLLKSPNDGDVLFALSLIALEHQDDETAQRYLERMVRWDRRVGEAHFYLGGIAERRGDVATAIREYQQAGTGYEFVPAQARIAQLLADDGRWQEAHEHLERMRVQFPDRSQQLIMVEAQLLTERGRENEALAFLDEVLAGDPQNIEMLYFRAMTGQRFGRLDILENDLRSIIEMDPDNADALNALGYTLTDQTDRHEEALALIEKALALKPDEAAFIDSMGWVQYRLNNLEEAVKYLRRALELFQNDEVAAHLGEVLWVMGEKVEAEQIWQEALQLTPESEILKEVIRRLTEQ